MTEVAVPLLYLAVAIFAAGFAWLVYATVQVGWRWTLATLLLAGLPLPLFCIRHWRQARAPLALIAVAPALGIGVLVAAGDLVSDRHPDELPERTFEQRLFGCSGSALWRRLQAADAVSIEELVGPFPMAQAPLSSEIEIGRAAVHAAALAYLDPTAARRQASRWKLGGERLTTHVARSQFALTLARDDALIVAFRGTDDAEDWLANVTFTFVATDWGVVHKGFSEALDSLWPSLSVVIERASARKQPIWLTGHSLGGALAVLAAARLRQQGKEVAGVVTFGQPPAGYETFAESFAHRFGATALRFVNHVDAVVDVATPFTALKLTHPVKPLYFDTGGQLHHGEPGIVEAVRDAVCAPAFDSGAEFKAHGVRRYVTLLEHAAQAN